MGIDQISNPSVAFTGVEQSQAFPLSGENVITQKEMVIAASIADLQKRIETAMQQVVQNNAAISAWMPV